MVEHASDAAAPLDAAQLAALAQRIRRWGRELGFAAVGIADVDLSSAEPGLLQWLADGCHGEMDYMSKHGLKRARPAELVPGTVRVISARIDYLPPAARAAEAVGETAPAASETSRALHENLSQASPDRRDRHDQHDWRVHEQARLADPAAAVVSLYARGRDYHKVVRDRLQRLATRIEAEVGRFGYRVFSDSAPVLEVELARRAGLGWRGKHTLLLQRDAGSTFFLGEIYVDLPLPTDAETAPPPVPEADGAHCGRCTRCLDACPTGAITAPYRVDARLCISYLTIELKGSIPEPLRPSIGNRVYGCDDCQLVCPWNKFAQPSTVGDFAVRHRLDRATLVELFGWSADEFGARLAGSAIRRIGYERWLRNLAVGLGNALRATARQRSDAAAQRAQWMAALHGRADDPSALVREHVGWALRQADV